MRKSSPITSRLACVLVASMVSMGVVAAVNAPAPRPTLVVGIFVKGLTADYVKLLRSNFGNDGFNRFIDRGVSIENVDFGPGIDATAATAMLVTGAAPGVNGVPSAMVLERESRQVRPALLPTDVRGSYTEQALAPGGIRVSTFSDEIRIASDGLGTVHSVAPDAQIAVILGGHAGNSAHWISDINGLWSSANHYRETPSAIAHRNVSYSSASPLDTLVWTPSAPLAVYPDLPDHKKTYPFRITFPARDADRFKAYKSSAAANRAVAQVGAEYISTLNLGGRKVTDVLNLGFDLNPYRYSRSADNRLETMDAYLRLDADIASIVKAIEKGPGMNRTLIFIAGTPVTPSSRREEDKWFLPTGQFSPKRAVSLLNLYLMALHGNGEWVKGFHNGFFYLNATLCKERGVLEYELRREAADFLARMSGVAEVYTIDDIAANRAGDNAVALHRNISMAHAGDVLVKITPGWEISDSKTDDVTELNNPVVRWQSSTAPVYILAPDGLSMTVDHPVDARSIAPTVNRLLRIRSPNAADIPPLRL